MELRDIFLSEAATIDGDVIRNVVVCGPTSKNGRRYSESALRKAAPMYEGMAVYCDHDYGRRKGRKVEERFGHLENVRFAEDGRVRGDLSFLATHPMATRVRESYTRKLPYFGLSHVADGRGHVEGDVTHVEEVTRVMSVDLVDTAATATLVEQAQPEGEDPFVAAAVALLTDTSMSKDDLLAKLGELWDTLRDGQQQPAEGEGEQSAGASNNSPPTMEQQIAALTEQVRQLQSRQPKYTKPVSAPVQVVEQATRSDVPTDRKELARWLQRA